MARLHEGRVVLITGAGGGVGREYALEFARLGAKVVVNDLGGDRAGSGSSSSMADQVVAEIKAMGGEAVANYGNVSSWDDGAAMIKQAVDTFGDLHAVVCNAGILRDRMFVNMSEAEWDAISTVHLKGTFVPARHFAAHCRDQHKKEGGTVHRALITTTSYVGLFGNVGQANYAPAKSHLAMLAQVLAVELARFNVTVNSLAPTGHTRLTADLISKAKQEQRDKAIAAGDFEAMAPVNNAAIVAWLCSPENTDVTGRIFISSPSKGAFGVALAEPYHQGPRAEVKGGHFETTEMGPVIRDLVAQTKVETFHETHMAGQRAAQVGKEPEKKAAAKL